MSATREERMQAIADWFDTGFEAGTIRYEDLLDRLDYLDDRPSLLRLASIAHDFTRIITCPQCKLPAPEGYICICGYDE